MADLQNTLNLADKLEAAAPVTENQQNVQVNLSSSYLSSNGNDAKASAFLNDATIETQISNAVATSDETKQKAEAAGLNVWAYDPMAEEKARAEAEAKAKKMAEEQEKLRIKEEQKEKLSLFLKWESSKNRKIWYLRGVFSWAALTIAILALTVVFAKEQVADLISKSWFFGENLQLSANIVEVTNNTDNEEDSDTENLEEETNDEISDEETSDEEISTDEASNDEQQNEENSDTNDEIPQETENEELPFFSNPEITDDTLNDSNEEISTDETSNDEQQNEENSDTNDEIPQETENGELPFFSNPEITDDTLNDSNEEISTDEASNDEQQNEIIPESENSAEDNSNNSEQQDEINENEPNENEENNTDNEENQEEPQLAYFHVNTVAEANWVMSANCNDLSCGDYTKATEELILCKDFKQKEDLTDDAHRIWSSWICRYKDESELVHLNLE